MSQQPLILITGATGYIGGTVLTELLKTHQAKKITAVVRDSAKVQLLEALGINLVVGSTEDAALMGDLAKSHDIVLNFSVPFGGGEAVMQAMVDGLEVRSKNSAIKPAILQISGTGSVMYGANGEAGQDVWSDEDYERLENLPNEAFFHAGDKIIARAALRGLISAYVLAAPTVYGPGLGLGNKLSLQVPAYVRYAKRTGQAAYIGKGENIWGNVHVSDLTDLYLLLIDHCLNHPEKTAATEVSRGWSNYLHAGQDQHQWGPIVSLIGDRLHARGEIPHAGATSIEEGKGEMYMFGGNSFMKISDKARLLGWTRKSPNLEDAIALALAVRS